MKVICKLFILLGILSSCSNSKAIYSNRINLNEIPDSISFRKIDNSGLLFLKKQKLTPDSTGVIADIKINFGNFERGIYFRPFSERPAAGNRVEPVWFRKKSDLINYKPTVPSFGNFMNLGTFIMLQKSNGNFLVILPIVSDTLGNTFMIDESGVNLRMATYGTEVEIAGVPLVAYAESSNPYEATRNAWRLAKNSVGVNGNIDWRSEKVYPKPFKYLGWCSWEHYRTNITEETIIRAIRDIKKSDIPIRWVLVDDGYLDYSEGKRLLSFGVNKDKFPNGWSLITSQKDSKIKWMGIWRNFNGYMGGISANHNLEKLEDDISEISYNGQRRYMPKVNQKSADAFYNQMTKDTRENGFDLIKVDFQSDNYYYYRGSKNAIKAVHFNQKSLEKHVKKYNLALINSIAMENFNLFNMRYSNIVRGSIDYKTKNDRVDLTIVQNFTNAFWLGHMSWIDQDMFYTSVEKNVKLMAISRAISGGPVYLSDNTKHIDRTYLDPIIFNDGKIIGTLAPGVPLPESIMYNPFTSHKSFKVIAPLKNNSAALMVVNLNRGDAVKSSVSINDYPYAGSLLQPFKGLWDIPEEGLLIYDYNQKRAEILSEKYSFELETRKECLFQITPIKDGWGIIGRSDKYLSASTYKLINSSEDHVKIRMMENGPLLIWAKGKKPLSKNFQFSPLGNGLWEGKLVIPNADKEYDIHREKL